MNITGQRGISSNRVRAKGSHAVSRELTLARTGGGVGATPPLRFFADSEKTTARSAAGFWATLWGKHCAIFGKKN